MPTQGRDDWSNECLMRFPQGAAALALGLVLGAYAIGCSDRVVQPRSTDPGPAPNSPANALRLLEWAYNNRSIEPYRRLLAGDFRFACSPADSAGNEWRGQPWTRDDELIFATHLLIGGGRQPPIGALRLFLDKNFFVFPDPGYLPSDPTGRWRKNVRTTLTILITTSDGATSVVTGHANFFLVRGDSAAIASDLLQQGTRPDSTRWYLRRWEDETEPSGTPGFAAQPASALTLCQLRAIYR